ncbi:hypothetical protein CGRA01v4_03196 [Colletotrichum graminicola]|nr:hypothetical protein CGRA01v4_03196 [Colletotrichum graminicola]
MAVIAETPSAQTLELVLVAEGF